MLTRSLIRLALASVSGLLLASCGYSPVITEDTISYNKAVAESTNEMLLLNIVRASERLPTYYTRLEGNTESTGLSSANSIAPPFSHGYSIAAATTASPGLTRTLAGITSSLGLTASDTSALNLQTLDDQKYQNGMMSILDMGKVEVYWDEGFQPDLLLLLTWQSVQIPRPVLTQLISLFDACDSQSGERALYCQAYKDGQASTKLSACGASDEPQDEVVFVNDPAKLDGGREQSCFNQLVLGFLAGGLDMDDVAKFADARIVDRASAADSRVQDEIFKQGLDSTNITVDGKAKTLLCKKLDAKPAFVLSKDDFKSIYDSLPKDSSSKGQSCAGGEPSHDIARLNIDVNVRSFEGIVYYLGEIVRAEAKDGSHQYVTIVSRDPWSGSYSKAPLFVALQGAGLQHPAVDVSDDSGNNYAIPQSCETYPVSDKSIHGPSQCTTETPYHWSLQTLAMINQIWGLNKESTVGPQNAAVVVSTPTP